MMNTKTTMAADETVVASSSSVSVLTGMKLKAIATASRPADMPQTVETRTRLRPIGSTVIMLTQVITKFVPATTKPTATGLEKPTSAKRVEE